MQFSIELQKRITDKGDNILSVAAHPGVTESSLTRHMPEKDFKAAMKQFGELMPAWQGALPSLFAATSPLVKPGGYYGPDGEDELRGFPGPALISEAANDKKAAKKLWQFAQLATGINFPYCNICWKQLILYRISTGKVFKVFGETSRGSMLYYE